MLGLIEVQISLFCTGKPQLNPYGHEGTHTKVSKLRINALPISGIVDALSSWQVSHPNPTISFYQSHFIVINSFHLHQVIFTFPKRFNRMSLSFQGFHNHLVHKCSHLELIIFLSIARDHDDSVPH